ncbi:MAG: hypothetical protein ACWA5L_01330 [bacterium]
MSGFLKEVIFGDGAIFGLDSGLWQNGITEIGGIILSAAVTYLIVDRVQKEREKKRWLSAENKSLDRLKFYIADFRKDNFSPKNGYNKYGKTILKNVESFETALENWAQASILPFMLGGNRKYDDLSRMTAIIQKTNAFIKGFCRLAVYKNSSIPDNIRDALYTLLELSEGAVELIRANYSKTDKSIDEIVSLLDEIEQALCKMGLELDDQEKFIPLLKGMS